MSQEITVLVLIDVKAAIETNSIKDHIYLVDNLRTEGSEGIGTADLTSAANGSHWFNGKQAYEPLFNWLPYGIASMSPSLPKTYHKRVARESNKSAIQRSIEITKSILKPHKGRATLTNQLSGIKKSLGESLEHIHKNDGIRIMVKNAKGVHQDTGLKLMNKKGELLEPSGIDQADFMNHMTPQISDITGEAVDKGILYPAQYGTPILIKDGWYWSGTVSTYKPGTYSYTMHITLYKLAKYDMKEKIVLWEPVYFSHDAKIKVSSKPMVNGFTKGGLWYLPVT